MPTLQEQFAAAKERMKAAQEEARTLVRDVFKQSAATLFEAHPVLESFGWTQYTPYFNDGDECVFGVHQDKPSYNGDDSYDRGDIHETKYESVGGKYTRVPNEKYDATHGAAFAAVKEFLGQFSADDYRAMFGDHVEITVHRDGNVDVDEHSHD